MKMIENKEYMGDWVRFVKNIYKDESYLTHTLPVSKNQIKKLKKISNKLRCPIIFIDNIDFTPIYNLKNHTYKYLTKKDIAT